MEKAMKIDVKQNALTPEIYCSLRQSPNFATYSLEDAQLAISGGLFSVVVFVEEKAVAIGRVVGDGRIAFFIKDVVVAPGYEGYGFGTIVVEQLLEYIEKVGCENAYIGLMSTVGKEAFYGKFGFLERPNQNMGAGMIKFLEKR